MALSIDTSDKTVINGCDLLNRHELSRYQDRELQRFIDENSHILSYQDKEKPEPPRHRSASANSTYSTLTRNLDRGASPHTGGYTKLDTYFRPSRKQESSSSEYRRIGDNTPLISPNGQRVNYTSDFAGLTSENGFGDVLPPVPFTTSRSRTPSVVRHESLGRDNTNGYRSGGSEYGTLGRGDNTNGYRSGGSEYGTVGRGGLKNTTATTAVSPYGSLKRKGVSWSDQERARSLSPLNNYQRPQGMSQFGSTGNLSNFRDRTASPAYSALGKHRDEYNRFETARHMQHSSRRSAEREAEESKFRGFGDRPGSGVEMTSHSWQGGEIITDPNAVPKSLKPRRFYYSPIGDGTVAADGYELKRRPVDLSPRVTITQLQHVDRGEPGHGGVHIYEKSWSNTLGSAPASEAGFGSEYGPGSGRNSRAGALSPAGSGLGGPGGRGLGSGLGGPGSGLGGPGSGLGGEPKKDPYGTLDSRGSGNPFGSNGNLGPHDGRTSVASSVFSDPSYRLDTKTGYLITNPRELIHQYATTTPIAVMDANDHTPTTTTISKQSMYRKTEETTEERFSPYAPYKSANNVQSPNKFVRQLRDETMTSTQREANTHVDRLNQRDPHAEQKINEIRQKTHSSRGGADEIDHLTHQLMTGLHSATPVPSRF